MGQIDKLFGGIISLIAFILIVAWLYFVWYVKDLLAYSLAYLLIKIFVTILFLVIVLILFWIGYTIVTTPSIEEIEAHIRKKRK